MKKYFPALIIALALTLPALSVTLYVPGQYPTIQAAVNAANAGDVVMVAPGVYYEHVEILTSIELIGMDMYNTIIDAEGVDKCVYINASDTFGKINGFTLRNSGLDYTGGTANCAICIKTYGTGNWEISNNIIKENLSVGILSFGNGVIHHNVFENNGFGGGFARAIFASSYSTNTIAQNDFKDNVTAIYAHSATVSVVIQNNIIIENQVGIAPANNTYTIAYNDVWNNGTNYSGCSPGIGDISQDPLCIGGNPYCYYLTATSPCIDAGSPLSPPDPDGTTADMGAFFYYQGGIPLEVTLTPFNPPIQIPQTGGEFEFNIEIANTGADPVNFDIWTMITLPAGGEFGPIINFHGFTMGGGSSADRDRNQAIPLNAPPGVYSYNAYAGIYPFSVWAEDSFDFEKLTDGDGHVYKEWESWGEDFKIDTPESVFNPAVELENYHLISAYPNPFNPNTTVSLILQNRENVTLTVYNIQGRLISTLTDGYLEAGQHDFNFDGRNLPSGVYFLNMITSESRQTEKLILAK